MIYFDHNATTIMHPQVRELITSLNAEPLNASAVHACGRKAKNIVENARAQIAKAVGIGSKTKDYQIIFTSSGTEANNLLLHNFRDGEIFISATEHLSVFAYNHLPNVKTIKVDSNGIIDLEDLQRLLAESTAPEKLVCVMLANNETGIIQPLKQVAEIASSFGALVHSDCVQALGKITLDINDYGLDFVTLSGHKCGGPIGSGALIARQKHRLRPMIIGGGQERGLRCGTENIAAIAGFGLAAESVTAKLSERQTKMLELQSLLERKLTDNFPELKIIGQNMPRLPNTTLLLAPWATAEMQLIALDLRGIAVSSGSACSSGKVGVSHVLRAMNIAEKLAKCAIRVSLSPYNTAQEIEIFVNELVEIYKKSVCHPELVSGSHEVGGTRHPEFISGSHEMLNQVQHD